MCFDAEQHCFHVEPGARLTNENFGGIDRLQGLGSRQASARSPRSVRALKTPASCVLTNRSEDRDPGKPQGVLMSENKLSESIVSCV